MSDEPEGMLERIEGKVDDATNLDALNRIEDLLSAVENDDTLNRIEEKVDGVVTRVEGIEGVLHGSTTGTRSTIGLVEQVELREPLLRKLDTSIKVGAWLLTAFAAQLVLVAVGLATGAIGGGS